MEFEQFLDECVGVTELARGGQKVVYRADHPKWGAVAVKKIIHGDHEFSVERLRREIRAVELIDSPNIPAIFLHNCNESGTNCYFVVERFVAGTGLRECIATGQTFGIAELVKFLETSLDVLVLTERQQIVHRDIKPENIIRGNDGAYWILDFGISRHLDLKSITPDNAPFGLFTLGYAASEQFRSLKKQIDIRSDLFSLGVVATEMCSGSNPFVKDAQNYQTILKRIESQQLPFLKIAGDTQYQLATFIRVLGDNRQTRRPRTAFEARQILEVVKTTLRLGE